MVQRGPLSPDGLWLWDGGAWVPAPRGATAAWHRGYAGFWLRLAAAFVDGLVLIPVWFVGSLISSFAQMGAHAAQTNGAVSFSASFLPWVIYILGAWVYYALMESSRPQGTLGKMAVGIVVTDLEGSPLSFGRASARYWAKGLSIVICYVGFLIAAFTQRKQALHDLVAGTLVLRKSPSPQGAAQGGMEVGVLLGIVGGMVGILFLTSILVIVILLTMGNQIKNVFSNVVVALGSG
jgi:uncharacterized RDD family membrane protein YckC